MFTSADTNLFVYAYNQGSNFYHPANAFIAEMGQRDDFVLCELILVEIYMQLRNPAVVDVPLSAEQAVDYIQALRSNPRWGIIDYDRKVADKLWERARQPRIAFRNIIDCRLALTLRYHGVTHFATANVRDFRSFGFEKVWNPIKQ